VVGFDDAHRQYWSPPRPRIDRQAVTELSRLFGLKITACVGM